MVEINLPLILGFTIAIFLLLQGLSMLISVESQNSTETKTSQLATLRYFGYLTLLIAALLILSLILTAYGRLQVGPEFDVLLIQGTPYPALGLAVLLVGSSLGIGLAWSTARVWSETPSKVYRLLGAGLVVGIASVASLRTLNPGDLPRFQVLAYDLWMPPLLLWMGAALSEISLTLLVSHNTRRETHQNIYAMVVISLFLLFFIQLIRGDSQNRINFTVELILWFIALIAASTRLLFSPTSQTKKELLSKPRKYLHSRVPIHPLLPISWHRRDFRRLLRVWRKRGVVLAKQISAWFTSTHVVICVHLTVIVLGLVGLLFFSNLPSSIPLGLFLLAWISLGEQIRRSIRAQIRGSDNWLQRWKEMKTNLSEWLKGLTSLPSTPVAIIKVFFVVGLLIALSEVPNANKTLIQPFSSSAIGSNDQGLSASVPDKLFNQLNSLARQIQPELIVPSAISIPGEGNTDVSGKVNYQIPGDNTIDLNTVLSESPAMKLGPVEVPLKTLLAPIQVPVRALLGVNSIKGIIEPISQTMGYVVTASDSTGHSWRIESKAPDPSQAMDELLEKLSYNILSQDPRFEHSGLSQSWPAYKSFQEGMQAWLKYRQGNLEALKTSRQNFFKAVQEDPGFALAYYRLGLALQAEGQPDAATDALRSSLANEPKLSAAYNALAYNLYSFNDFYLPDAAYLPPTGIAHNPEMIEASKTEARHLWQESITLSDDPGNLYEQAVANYGLCQSAFDEQNYLLAYFHCKRAEKLFETLPPHIRESAVVRKARAYTLNFIGVIVLYDGNQQRSLSNAPWNCLGYQITKDNKTPLEPFVSPAALYYYQRALDLLPNDPVIRCNTAIMRYALHGDPQPLQDLERDSSAHLSLADNYSQTARSDAFDSGDNKIDAINNYKAALDEYQKAIVHDPNNFLALNGYGYTAWEWHLNWVQGLLTEGPEPKELCQAESYALTATDLARATHSQLDQAITQSTYGEVLLGQVGMLVNKQSSDDPICSLNRWNRENKDRKAALVDVIQVLEISANLTPQISAYDEIRWDLTQAILCTGDEALSNSSRASEILSNEKEHIYQPFNRDRSLTTCVVIPQ